MPRNGWTPATKVPETAGLYLVTEQMTGSKVIGISRWNGEEWEVLPFSEVIAWSELPQPYSEPKSCEDCEHAYKVSDGIVCKAVVDGIGCNERTCYNCRHGAMTFDSDLGCSLWHHGKIDAEKCGYWEGTK